MSTALAPLRPLTRFSNRVENYTRYRPGYPTTLVPFLETTAHLKETDRIVDIGCGTGNFAALFLEEGYPVTGLEPNEAMRLAGEKKLAAYPHFLSLDRTAEETGLAAASVDLITVAQAFHWMDVDQIKREFARILRPGGHVVLAWNIRLERTAFCRAYETLRRKFATDYNTRHMISEEKIRRFFDPHPFISRSFANEQWVDFEGLKGQLLSSSFIPLPGDPHYPEMISELADLFVAHNEKGLVRIEYETRLYLNQ